MATLASSFPFFDRTFKAYLHANLLFECILKGCFGKLDGLLKLILHFLQLFCV